MRALRIHTHGDGPRLEEVADPIVTDGDVLVRVEAAAVSHFDLGIAAGVLPLPQPLPFVPGSEGAGRLEDGTLVRILGGGIGFARPGTWAELVAAPERALVPVPEGVAAATAAAAGTSLNTAWASLHDLGALAEGERVGVAGADGAVGSLVLQMATAAGHATHAWSLDAQEDPEEPVDLLVDTVGGPGLLGRLRQVRPGGRAVLIGYVAGTDVPLDLAELIQLDVALLPLNMRRRRVPRDVTARLFDDVAAGVLRVDTDVVAAEDINEGIARLQAGRASGKLVVGWSA